MGCWGIVGGVAASLEFDWLTLEERDLLFLNSGIGDFGNIGVGGVWVNWVWVLGGIFWFWFRIG